ncbi:hypothetical protein FE257_010801 [Aspergillus nanangensis]|uniref:chitinase n=1 Tax=Aspergillus nanangensis TaxID=2582783 RepID=A0AAD4GX59_ASPNN|nr:hypothetical protein FE257_010801 [Aspergillus nanangensis]
MKRLTSLKRTQPFLKVNIAIGGWTFNDPGPTATTFSDLASSEANQRKFFKSLISFMSTYGFDGVDLDWEYPAADDRSGRLEDFANFPEFIANLKATLLSSGGRNGLSLTIPTSYWYLQHFDIKALAKNVDYFNYMSYDLHGKWDRGNKWTGAFLDSHSNLTEIRDVMDLLWRNEIDSGKVVLGLPFYGRVFTLADRTCKEPGCIFASAGNAGNCSLEAGVLLNSELDDIRAERNIKPSFDRDAAAQILTWDDQWATYDDSKTFQLKLDFARTTCLGGVMVWAVSHDTYDGAYSSALVGITPHPLALAQTVNDRRISTYSQKPVCKWSACGETCKDGLVTVSRSDSGYRPGELMQDGTRCDEGLLSFLCCPKKDVSRCGWYGFNGGKCSPDPCPGEMFEIGSIDNGCETPHYQKACCEMNHDSTRLYWNTTEWSTFPHCNDASCPWANHAMNTTLVKSDQGSGGGHCSPIRPGITYGPFEYEQRSLCYNPNIANMTWTDCDWSTGGVCLKSNGIQAYCCKPTYVVLESVENPEMKLWKDRLAAYLDTGTCSTALDEIVEQTSSSLVERDKSSDYFPWLVMTLNVLIRAPYHTSMQENEIFEWNNLVKQKGLDHLVMDQLLPYLIKSGRLLRQNTIDLARDILCRLYLWDARVDGEDESECSGDVCAADVDPTLCEEEDGEDDEEDDDTADDEAIDIFERASTKRKDRKKKFKVWCAAIGKWEENVTIEAFPYPRSGLWEANSPQYRNARTWEDPNDCGNPKVISQIKNSLMFDTEHVLELQLIPLFFQHLTAGTLTSGKPARFSPVDCLVFLNTTRNANALDVMNSDLMDKVPGYSVMRRPDSVTEKPASWIMEVLGTTYNKENFYLLQSEINGMKKRVFGNVELVDTKKMAGFVIDTKDPAKALKEIKTAIGVWSYLNDVDVKISFGDIFRNVRNAFKAINAQYKVRYLSDPVLEEAWDEWFRDMMEYQVTRSYNWIGGNIGAMRVIWQAMPQTQQQALIIGHLNTLSQGLITHVHYDTSVATFPRI